MEYRGGAITKKLNGIGCRSAIRFPSSTTYPSENGWHWTDAVRGAQIVCSVAQDSPVEILLCASSTKDTPSERLCVRAQAFLLVGLPHLRPMAICSWAAHAKCKETQPCNWRGKGEWKRTFCAGLAVDTLRQRRGPPRRTTTRVLRENLLTLPFLQSAADRFRYSSPKAWMRVNKPVGGTPAHALMQPFRKEARKLRQAAKG